MIRVPMLEDQISQSEFFYEKICLVLYSQSQYDCMWTKNEKLDPKNLYTESQLDELIQMHLARRVDAIEHIPEGLQKKLKLIDKAHDLAAISTGGLENPAPQQCKCEKMSLVTPAEDRV